MPTARAPLSLRKSNADHYDDASGSGAVIPQPAAPRNAWLTMSILPYGARLLVCWADGAEGTCPWYKGLITRAAACALVRGLGSAGAFVVRRSRDNARVHVVTTAQPSASNSSDVKVVHIRIHVRPALAPLPRCPVAPNFSQSHKPHVHSMPTCRLAYRGVLQCG